MHDARFQPGRGFFSRLIAPPTFDDQELTERAQMVRRVVLLVTVVSSVLIAALAFTDPSGLVRGARSLVVANVLAVVTLFVNARGRPTLAGWIFLSVMVAQIALNALSLGGIRSSGVQSLFIVVMLAGLMVGYRGASLLVIVCGLVGLGLVVAEQRGFLVPPPRPQGPVSLWIVSTLYLGIAFATMRAATGQIARLLQRTRAELADRKEAEAKLSRALEAGQIGTFAHDFASGLVRLDEKATHLLGVGVQAGQPVTLHAWLDRVYAEDRSQLQAAIGNLDASRRQAQLHYRYNHPSGSLLYIEAAVHLDTTADQRPAIIYGLLWDVTARRLAELEREQLVGALAERVKELRALHEAARVLQAAADVDAAVLTKLVNLLPAAWEYADDAMARIVYRETEVSTQGWCVTPWCQSAAFVTSDGDGLIEVAYRSAHPDADEGPFLKEERALLSSLAELLRANIEQRVTERHRAQLEEHLRQAQRLDALGRLAGGIAHDFNNILTAIGGHAQLLALEAPAGSAMAQSASEIQGAHERARALVRRILLFSRREDTTERRVLSVGPVVTEAVNLLRVAITPNVEIQYSAAPGLPNVLADPTQLHQVVMNLGTNAIYAMQARGGVLAIDVGVIRVDRVGSGPSAELAPGDFVRLAVRDTGSGMSAEVRDRLFEPFFTTKGQAGTGLGLSMVHGIVRDHGGEITVSSEIGVGSVFEIFLPVHASAPEPAAVPLGLPRGRGQRIMYVDDETALTLVMSRTLRYLGYQCVDFCDAESALHEFRTSPRAFDAVISDLQMPGMSGLEFLREIRALRADIPVAVVSGYTAEAIDDADVGSVVWLHKPMALHDLATAIYDLAHVPSDATRHSGPA